MPLLSEQLSSNAIVKIHAQWCAAKLPTEDYKPSMLELYKYLYTKTSIVKLYNYLYATDNKLNINTESGR